MMRSLYSGVSGLKNHQTRMDVIGNNIANVNTAGYKTSRVVFQDVYSQMSKGASAPNGTIAGGTNPMQIGLGVNLAAIDIVHTSAATQRTDRELDLAIEGDGYFAIAMPTGEILYTRAGNFYLDEAGNLVTNNGNFVLGIQQQVTYLLRTHDIDTTGATPVYTELPEPILVVSDPTSAAATLYDASTPVDNDYWDEVNGELVLNKGYQLVTGMDPMLFGLKNEARDAADGPLWGLKNINDNLKPDVMAKENLTLLNITGYNGISISDKGVISGLDENNERVTIGIIALATFTNTGGLEKKGNNLYAQSVNTGEPVFGQAQTGAAGKINPGGLEMSNVDLSTEFTDMIVTQRGFQANSRIITVSDTLLEELINLKR